MQIATMEVIILISIRFARKRFIIIIIIESTNNKLFKNFDLIIIQYLYLLVKQKASHYFQINN